MYLFTALTYLLISTVVSHEFTTEKCCNSGEYLQKNNTNYQCIEDPTKRLGVITNETNFLQRFWDGECIDIINNNFSVFQVSDGKITKEETLNETYFPKCCPLNYYYNSVLHSCEERSNLTHDYIRETFVKVGLPTCKLIVDHELRREIDVYETVIDVRRSVDFCIDENEKGDFTLRQCREDTEVCDHMRCIKKCCPDGQSFVNGAKCVDTYTHGLNLSFSSRIEQPEEPFAVISNRTCKRIYIMNEKRFIFTLTKDGIFSYWVNHTNSFVNDDIDYKYSYCIEHSMTKNAEGFLFFKCFEENEYKQKFEYTIVPKILSCIFLGLTIIIYIVLNETRSLFGKILMNYCIATLLLFSLLVYAQVYLAPTDGNCKLTAYTLIFFSTVSFAWLNIMCCDIWWTFGSTKQSIGVHQKKKDLKRLLWYLLYGWGMPTALTLIIFSFSKSTFLPYAIHPFVGTSVCFIENRPGNYAAMLFLRFPHLVIQLINTVLFFKTILYCLKIKNEINRINDTSKYEKKNNFKRDKERLSLILKLSVIMGLTFIFDVMSSFFDMSKMGTVAKYVEIVWDCINCLQGVFIFIIFICKKKVYYDFLRIMRISRGASTLNNQQSVTSTTRMSVTNSHRTDSRMRSLNK